MPECSGPLLWLGPQAKSMHHLRGELQHEPVDPEHHWVPSKRHMRKHTLHQNILGQCHVDLKLLWNPLWRWGTSRRMVVLVSGLHGNPATRTTARALSAGVAVDPGCVTAQWPNVVGWNVRAQLSRWQTVPGTVRDSLLMKCLSLKINHTQ